MNEPNPKEGVAAGDQPAPTPKTPDGIAPGEPPAPAEKKPYEQYDDETAMPSLAKSGAGAADGAGMQSLAQAARGTQLNQARWTMLIIGALTAGINVFYFMTNAGIPPAQRAPDFDFLQMINVAFAGMGIVFMVLGLAVKSSPVLCTSLGMGIYVLAIVVSGVMDPMTLGRGIIVKIIIVVALFNAIKAARAYEAEQQADAPM